MYVYMCSPEWLEWSVYMLRNVSRQQTNEHSKILIQTGVIKPLFALLKSPQTDVADSVTEALVNLCADGINEIKIQDHALKEGPIAPIVHIFEPPNLHRVNFYQHLPVAFTIIF